MVCYFIGGQATSGAATGGAATSLGDTGTAATRRAGLIDMDNTLFRQGNYEEAIKYYDQDALGNKRFTICKMDIGISPKRN